LGILQKKENNGVFALTWPNPAFKRDSPQKAGAPLNFTLGPMEQEFVESSKEGRQKIILLVVVILLIGVLAKFILMPKYFAFVKSLPPCEQLPWLQGALAVAICSVPAVAIFWAIPHARKLLKYQQIPFPDAMVWRRTPVKRGPRIRWRAYGLIVWSLLAVIFPFWAWNRLDFFFITPKQCSPNTAVERDAPPAKLAPRPSP
jgi:hypothetical protein